jgi:CRP/FNR family transcriptional regulator, anaerobic regulatory protein
MTDVHAPFSFEQAALQVPMLATVEPDVLHRAGQSAQVVSLPAGVTVFEPGSACRNYIVVLDGSVKVRLLAASGREIVLYRVASGETCVLTTSCLIQGTDYDAEAVTETAVKALLIPRAAFDEMMNGSGAFRQFIFSSFSTRLNELLGLVNEVAFGHIDRRLAAWLLARAKAGHVEVTHQAIAAELGTAREVVSRLLKELERRGLVALNRGEITVTDEAGLRQLAATD